MTQKESNCASGKSKTFLTRWKRFEGYPFKVRRSVNGKEEEQKENVFAKVNSTYSQMKSEVVANKLEEKGGK